jgi:1,4-dihydroxy-2-naphthoate polyprenyltransferase
MKKLTDILGPMRLPFLVLTPACVLLGVGTANAVVDHIDTLLLILVFIGAIASHISVNVFNEYFDYKSGLDSKTNRTPFSGGSGTLQANPSMTKTALNTAIITFLITFFIGIYFVIIRGWGILPLGILGLLLIFLYTQFVTKKPFLCLIAPGLGFGTFMVMGTNFVLSGEYSWASFIASFIPFFLVSDLLFLNQFPDVDADQSVGRRHYPILLKRKQSSEIYILFLFFNYLSITIGVVMNILPVWCLLGLLTIFLAVPASIGAYKYGEDIQKLIPNMVLNVIINILTPVLTAIGLFIEK